MYAIITPMKYLRHLLIVLLAIIILGGTLVASVSAYSSPPPTSVAPQPFYHQPTTASLAVACPSGSTILAQVRHWPQPGATTWTAHFLASGGDYVGGVMLSLPLGYEEGVDIPALSSYGPYTITVHTPPYIGSLPVLVGLYAQCPQPPGPPGPPTSSPPSKGALAPMNIWAIQLDVN
jgi:hypothetical protein